MARTIEIKHKFPEYAICTDAATSARITAALVFNNEVSSDHPIIDELREEIASPFVKQHSTAQLTSMDSI